MPARRFPARPNLHQLKHQAMDLLHAFRDGDPSAIADFREYHPERIDATGAKLADAQSCSREATMHPVGRGHSDHGGASRATRVWRDCCWIVARTQTRAHLYARDSHSPRIHPPMNTAT
jgi:hypothetical protein